MSMQEKVAVKFIKHWRGYNAGEIACFEPDLAQRLHDGKVAEKLAGGGTKATKGRGDKAVQQASTAPPAAPSGEQGQGPAPGDANDERP